MQGSFWIFCAHLFQDRTSLYGTAINITTLLLFIGSKREIIVRSLKLNSRLSNQVWNTEKLFHLLLFAFSSEMSGTKKYFPYPHEPFSFGKHLGFSSPYSWKGLKLAISSSCKTWHSKPFSYVPPLLGMPTQFWENCVSLLLKSQPVKKIQNLSPNSTTCSIQPLFSKVLEWMLNFNKVFKNSTE